VDDGNSNPYYNWCSHLLYILSFPYRILTDKSLNYAWNRSLAKYISILESMNRTTAYVWDIIITSIMAKRLDMLQSSVEVVSIVWDGIGLQSVVWNYLIFFCYCILSFNHPVYFERSDCPLILVCLKMAWANYKTYLSNSFVRRRRWRREYVFIFTNQNPSKCNNAILFIISFIIVSFVDIIHFFIINLIICFFIIGNAYYFFLYQSLIVLASLPWNAFTNILSPLLSAIHSFSFFHIWCFAGTGSFGEKGHTRYSLGLTGIMGS